MRIGYLVFAANPAYVTVTEDRPEGVCVDVGNGVWTYEHGHDSQCIGCGRYLGKWRGGVIGVYDLENLEHLKCMVHDAVESQRDYADAE